MALPSADKFVSTREFAQSLDGKDPLHHFREQFFLPVDKIYLDGNSLGLMPRKSEIAIQRVLNEWKSMGIGGWLNAQIPWFYFSERMGEKIAPIVGAKPSEVVMTGTTTINLHSLVSTFYQPEGAKTKILADELNFPNDLYALGGQIQMKGLNLQNHLVLVPSEDGKTLDEQKIIEMMTPDIALIILPSVLYRSGQLLNIAHLTKEAHARNIVIGFDCCHSVGAVPHKFDEWDVDFAFWCSYKYLNSGPGAPGFLYINERHFSKKNGLIGWFGYIKEKQFDMALQFEQANNAGGWQISSPGIIAAGGVEGALEITLAAGIEQIRKKSLHMTEYLIFLVKELLSQEPYSFLIGTPLEPTRRSGHIALEREKDAYRINKALIHHGFIPDFRPPNVIRIAPIALYNTYEEVWNLVQTLKQIIDTKEYLQFSEERSIIS
ncbi:kynureninase [Candidatus Lokiarchaeum ossiferum]|uniref:kynureninase n=1 Tax=Candidatus Lokiarchaeum ossiferum TaxID=2951803 RepID=UPI00352E580A